MNAISGIHLAAIDTQATTRGDVGTTALAVASQQISQFDAQATQYINNIQRRQQASTELQSQQNMLNDVLNQLGGRQSGFVVGDPMLSGPLASSQRGGAIVANGAPAPASAVLAALGVSSLAEGQSASTSYGTVTVHDGIVVFSDASQAARFAADHPSLGSAAPVFEVSRDEITGRLNTLAQQASAAAADGEIESLMLQSVLQKRAEAMQLVSNILKDLHDMAMSVIKNLV